MKKNMRIVKKLSLSRQTLRRLSAHELRRAAGGTIETSDCGTTTINCANGPGTTGISCPIICGG